jgi:hypothetical protein
MNMDSSNEFYLTTKINVDRINLTTSVARTIVATLKGYEESPRLKHEKLVNLRTIWDASFTILTLMQ